MISLVSNDAKSVFKDYKKNEYFKAAQAKWQSAAAIISN